MGLSEDPQTTGPSCLRLKLCMVCIDENMHGIVGMPRQKTVRSEGLPDVSTMVRSEDALYQGWRQVRPAAGAEQALQRGLHLV
jgi:hypothetical protein